ncbi:MAG: hypothetical protein FJ255_06120 [Phycisphaerae bacterium]|nr:hypothetical protein [Phycisphaerae bacterium]
MNKVKNGERFRPLVRRHGRIRKAGFSAADVASRAGGIGDGATMDQLEPRKLLFALVVNPTDPTFEPGPAGYGTVTAWFGYTIPYLDTSVQEGEDPVFADIIRSRIFGAVVRLSGPVGAQAEFFDLYGNAMRQTIVLGVLPGADPAVTEVDPDDDGIPNFNDGIGRIVFSGVDARSAFMIWGTTLDIVEQLPADADFFEVVPDGFAIARIVTSATGNFGAFETTGFGYQRQVQGTQPQILGLPPGPGSVIIGSPIVRSLADYNPSGRAMIAPMVPYPNIIRTGFTDTTQGVFVNAAGGNPASMGLIYIHGVLHGTSVFSGSLNKMYVGYLVGSLNVAGDLGSLVVGTDAGRWSSDTEATTRVAVKTGSQLIVGRTVGDIYVGGRSSMDVTVIGDLNSPTTRPGRSVISYSEKESVYGQTRTGANPTRNAILTTIGTSSTLGERPTNVFRLIPNLHYAVPLQYIVGNTFLRNDSLLHAEWIGSASSGVRIEGELGGQDAFNTGDDQSDVFAFAARRGVAMSIELSATTRIAYRIVDQDGRTLASPKVFASRTLSPRGRVQGESISRVRFTPDRDGVYYLVIADPGGNDNTATDLTPYTVTIAGMAATTLGAYRTGAYSGYNTGALSNVISVLSGDVGAFRVGLGAPTATGAPGSPSNFLNPTFDAADPLGIDNNDDNLLTFRGGAIGVTGNVYSIFAGGDMRASLARPLSFSVSGNIASIVTGRNPLAQNEGGGGGATGAFSIGDIFNAQFRVGGSIGEINVGGGVGITQNTDPHQVGSPVSVTIETGLNGGRGDIGVFRVGYAVGGDTLSVRLTPGSVIGLLAVNQTSYDSTEDGVLQGFPQGNRAFFSNLGIGSDVRFLDTPVVQHLASNDAFITLLAGQTRELVDDSGSRVQISISPGLGVAPGSVVGIIRVVPIDGSLGVAIAQIQANLEGGAQLRIVGLRDASTRNPVSIGRIRVTGADAGSSIDITGQGEVDVWRIEQITPVNGPVGTANAAFASITNSTPNGDVVHVDVVGLNRLVIRDGSLGRTEMPLVGPQLIGPFMGVIRGYQERVGSPLGLGADALTDGTWNGILYRPIEAASVAQSVTPAWLDEVGSPVPAYVNGAIIRTGSIAEVTVAKQMGDLIMQGMATTGGVPGGNIGVINVNPNRIIRFNDFRGIVGVIFGSNIGSVNIGMGLSEIAQNPIATTGIFAVGFIGTVLGSQPGAYISAPIIAAGGLGRVSLTGGGSFVGAFIGSTELDDWWGGLLEFESPDPARGDIGEVSGIGANFYRSRIEGRIVNTVRFRGGTWDASQLLATVDAISIEADRFRNTTEGGGALELTPNELIVQGFVRQITAGNGRGNIEDLNVWVLGGVQRGLRAQNIIRSTIDVVNANVMLDVRSAIRSSTIRGGAVDRLRVPTIVSSSIVVAGPIKFVQSDVIANTLLKVDGPSGRIDRLVVRTVFDGDIISSGNIGFIRVLRGSMQGTVTTAGAFGSIGSIDVFGDLRINADISAGVGRIHAGGDLGDAVNPGSLVIRGDVREIATRRGRLFTNLRIAGSVTSRISVGGLIPNLPGGGGVGNGNIIVGGAIRSVFINGDFDGDIISRSGDINIVRITRGSFLPGNRISADVGSIRLLQITGGSLLGSIHAGLELQDVRITQYRGGFFGDVGVNPSASAAAASSDPFRNQLPPGVAPTSAIDGPTISAGRLIRRVNVAGSVFEGGFHAPVIQSIFIRGSVANDPLTAGTGTYFSAADDLREVVVGGDASNAIFVAGISDFGADGRPGGTGANADRVTGSGTVRSIRIQGSATDVRLSAGIDAGADGVYNTADDGVVLGSAAVGNVRIDGDVAASTLFADRVTGLVDARLGGPVGVIAPSDPRLDTGVGTPGVAFGSEGLTFVYSGATVTARLEGSGSAFWDQAAGKVTIRDTNLGSRLVVSAVSLTPGAAAVLTNFDIVSNDDASLGLLHVYATLGAGSEIVIDGDVAVLNLDTYAGGSSVVGGDVRSARIGAMTGGTFAARNAGDWTISGNFAGTGAPTLRFANLDVLTVTGSAGGAVAVAGGAKGIFVWGAADGLRVGVGRTLSEFGAASITDATIAAGARIDRVNVAGDGFRSLILAGVSFGANGLPGGTGADRDTPAAGSIGAVVIGGNFIASDIAAGVLKGPDSYYGTSDDSAGAGFSSIDSVRIGGTQVGTFRPGETYRIIASGGIGPVTVAGIPLTSSGNFAVQAITQGPEAIRVLNMSVGQSSRVYTVTVNFNQAIDASTAAAALTVSEVRGGTLIQAVLGTDYNILVSGSTLTVTFNQAVTERNLTAASQQTPGLIGPGVYRFHLSQAVLRAQLTGNVLDGNGDGVVGVNDHFSDDIFVGDAGDKLNFSRIDDGTGNFLDFYAPFSLTEVMDNNYTPDGRPDPSRTYTVRGFIGDHPDNNNTTFGVAGDIDVYSVTLQAGQILRLSELTGTARGSLLILTDDAGNYLSPTGTTTHTVGLPFETTPRPDLSDLSPISYLITQTGTYHIIVTNVLVLIPPPNPPEFWQRPTAIPNVPPLPDAVGDYRFTVDIFDDGDSGFSDPSGSGNGTNLVNAPLPSEFSGPGSVIVRNGFTFVLGADGATVTGSNGLGITSDRSSSGRLVTNIRSAIGPTGSRGTPLTVFPDVDVYHLNDRLTIAPGTRMTVTVKLSEAGSDLGSQFVNRSEDFRGAVQFALFDTSASTALGDAMLVFSPTDFKPTAQDPRLIANDGQTVYGYNANGDYYISFLVPERLDVGGAGTFALYIQGAFNSDYQIEVVTEPFTQTPQRKTQNVVIETRGGTLEWLEQGGTLSALSAFDASLLGFGGVLADGRTPTRYVLDTVVATLTSIFSTVGGFNIVFATDSSAFAGSDYSVVYITNSPDPINLLSGNQPFGYSQRSDPFNTDRNDEAVVFAQAFTTRGFAPSQVDLDGFSQAMTAAVGRRVGELLGLRMTGGYTAATFPPAGGQVDIMASNSVAVSPLTGGRTLALINSAPVSGTQTRGLSGLGDTVQTTDFFLGRQSSLSLLDRILARRP